MRVHIITVIRLITFLGISIKIKQDFWTTKNSSPAFVHLATIYQLWKREKKTLSLKLYYAQWIQMGRGLFYVHVKSICELCNRRKTFLKSMIKTADISFAQVSSIVLMSLNFYLVLIKEPTLQKC